METKNHMHHSTPWIFLILWCHFHQSLNSTNFWPPCQFWSFFRFWPRLRGLRSNIQANTCNIVANIISCQHISPKKWEYFRNRLGQENCAIILPHIKCHILKRISGKNINLSINLLLFLKGVSHFGHNTERYLRS